MKNKRVITGICVSVYVTVLVIGYFVEAKSLNDLYLISQIIASVIVVSGLIVSVLQYVDTSLSNSDIRKREKKVKAAEMANNFQKDLMPLMNALTKLYSDAKLNDTVINKIKQSNIKMFNKEEVNEIFSQEEVVNVLVKLQVAYLIEHYKPQNVDRDKETGEIHEVTYSEKDKMEAMHSISSIIGELSNGLEYFSINFNSGIADEDTVYQSLHGVFFGCVYMIYMFAFKNNEKESDRLFSNTSSLYNKWKQKHDQLAKDEEEEISRMKKSVNEKIVVSAKK